MARGATAPGATRILALPGGAPRRVEPRLPARQLERLRAQLRECAAGTGGEVSARLRAARLGETYLKLDDGARHEFLRLIALEFGPDPAAVAEAHAAYQQAIDTPGQWEAEDRLRAALRSSRLRILTQLNAIPQGVKFLVDLRADLLRHLEEDPELAVLDRELETQLSAWFDVGFLELARITWASPAALLEKLIKYEAVHEIRSWDDLHNRVDSDRRLYAFFHPRMPMEPLIFVEVALTAKMADSIHPLLDETAPVFDVRRAETAIFYSISNTQQGLRGVSFGNFLLKRVIDDLKRDFPRLKTFATLSPIPQLRGWAARHPEALARALTAAEWRRLAPAAGVPGGDAAALVELLVEGAWTHKPALARLLRDPLERLAARYLMEARNGGRPFDPVARFHLGNGARIERLNWMADLSPKGLAQSFGMMVNYLYDPEAIEENVEAFVGEGRVAASASLRRLARPMQT
jgi:malonyl-CoA decarboxylase